MSEFVTLDRLHPDFRKYLLGKVSPTLRALPVQTSNLNQQTERVTFRVVERSTISRPHLFQVIAKVMRMDLLPLTLLPPIVVAAYFAIYNLEITLSLTSLFFLHGAVFCRNDFMDHMQGLDRMNEKGGSRVIQNGWLTAASVHTLYLILLTLGLIAAMPVLVLHTELTYLAIFVGFFAVLGYAKARLGTKLLGLSDLIVFLCLGPLLTIGTEWAARGQYSHSTLLLGFIFGYLALIYVEVRHLISIVVDDETQHITIPVKLGFDRAKKMVMILLATFVCLLALFVVTNLDTPPSINFAWGATILFIPSAMAISMAKKTWRVTSPLSSALYELPKNIVRLHVLTGLALVALTFL